MGINLQSCCHLCKVKVFHFRSEESITMMPFYYKHRKCLSKNPANLETKEDQAQEESWMYEYSPDEEIQKRAEKHYCQLKERPRE